MTDAESFEHCRKLVLDFCAHIAEEDRKLKADLRRINRKYERQRVRDRARMIRAILKKHR